MGTVAALSCASWLLERDGNSCDPAQRMRTLGPPMWGCTERWATTATSKAPGDTASNVVPTARLDYLAHVVPISACENAFEWYHSSRDEAA